LSDKQSIRVNPLRRVTLTDGLVTELRSQILSGQLGAGQQLPPESELGEAFGVGRTTVREALRGLVAGGFVERQGNRLVVTDPDSIARDQWDYAALASRTSVRDVYETRKLLEVRIAELAAEHRTEAGLEDMWQLLERTEMPHDDSFQGADAAFPDGIARICGNPILAEVYAHSRDLFFRLPTYWQLFGHHRGAQHTAEGGQGEHRRILQAIAGRDGDGAGAAMFDHLDRIKNELIARLKQPEAEMTGAKS
jgi:DNA-binding FadR family transcriptional regulator